MNSGALLLSRITLLSAVIGGTAPLFSAQPNAELWQAGVATRKLTPPGSIWMAGYSNNVFGYLGSHRVIEEGGYEGIAANIRILNHPGRFTTDAEDAIIGKVHELRRKVQP